MQVRYKQCTRAAVVKVDPAAKCSHHLYQFRASNGCLGQSLQVHLEAIKLFEFAAGNSIKPDQQRVQHLLRRRARDRIGR